MSSVVVLSSIFVTLLFFGGVKASSECAAWDKIFSYQGMFMKEGLELLGYNKNVTPKMENGNELIVNGSMVNFEFIEMDESRGVHRGKVTIRESWIDNRLSVPTKCRNLTISNQVPFSHFDLIWNLKSSGFDNQTLEGNHFNLYMDGNVSYLKSFETEMTSNILNPAWYPFDHLMIQMHNAKVVNFKGHFTYFINFNIEKIILKGWIVSIELDKSKEFFHVGIYSPNGIESNTTVVVYNFNLRRDLGNFALNTFIPSMMLCVVGCGSLFITSDAIPGRIAMSITSFLSLISLFNGQKNSWAESLSLRAIDVWVLLCYAGVFYALIESCTIIYMTKVTSWEEPFIRAEMNLDEMKLKVHKLRARARTIERISRIALPCYNLLFFTLYFIVCLNAPLL